MAIDSLHSAITDEPVRSRTKEESSAPGSVYTCPMHPEVQQDQPGNCPKCGMTLEPKTVTAGADDEESTELRDMTKRFWIGRRAGVAGISPGDGSLDSGPRQTALGGGQRVAVGAVCACHAGGLVGGLAALAARLALRGDPPSEHVHADRHRRGRGFLLERGGDARARRIPGHDATRGQGRHLLRIRGGDRCAGAPRAGARTPRPQPHGQRDQSAAQSRPAHGPASGAGRRS